MADYQLKRAAQRRIDSAPELKAPPSWLEEAVASLRRGIGRTVNEGWGYDIGNLANLLRGLPEVPSSYDRRQGIFHEPEPTTLTEDAVSVVADPINFIGGAMLKPAARAVRRALPTAAIVGSAAYAGDTEAGPLQRLAARLGKEAAPNRRGIANVIKEKGGNWLSGSVEGALSGLKKRVDPELEGYFRRGQNMMPEERAEVVNKVPINDWIDKQLTRYVKNEMATPEDPVRALAERGVLHFDPGWVPEGSLSRGQAAGITRGEQGRRLGKEKPARDWEDLTDQGIDQARAEEVYHLRNKNPWLEKVPGDAPVYGFPPQLEESLGFNHLIDELSNAINPGSGLPRNLQLDPKSLERVSVPQAVERVHGINLWRAAMKAEADQARANNVATVLHKEYPDKGMKWVELRKQDLPEGWVQEGSAYANPADPKAKWIYPEESLADALKYEGDTMGHCVGGYCEDVASGRSRIYSLRDAKGQPHVTIEVAPEKSYGSEHLNAQRAVAEEEAIAQGLDPDSSTFASLVNSRMTELAEMKRPQRIVQIKGKQNRAPNPEYLPFVQDFVRSGKWSDVGDLGNAGLWKNPKTGTFHTIEETEADPALQAIYESRNLNPDGTWNGGRYAHGGPVKPNKTLTLQDLSAIISALESGNQYA